MKTKHSSLIWDGYPLPLFFACQTTPQVCGQMDLAMPSELPAQLLRFCVFCDSQAVLQGLEQAKRHILAAVKHEDR